MLCADSVCFCFVKHSPMTVVETPTFLREAAALLTEMELTELVAFIATYPETGDLMAGTGGIRKLRWAARGKGKRGGVRVIYYYHGLSIPLFLLEVYAKSEKDNLTKAERNEMTKLVRRLVAGYQRKVGR